MTTKYLTAQTILTGLPEHADQISWTTGRPDDWADFDCCYVYYADGLAQEVIFPKTLTVRDFMATLRTMHSGDRGKQIVNVVMDR